MKRTIILIAGGTGSGKTTLANQLKDSFPEGVCEVVSSDNYYREFTESPADHNFDAPDAYDVERLARDVKALHEGETIQKIKWSFEQRKREIDAAPLPTSDAARIVVVEGLFALYVEEIRALADLKIFIDLDPKEGVARRLRRDQKTKERPTESFDKTGRIARDVLPGYEKYVFPTKRFADRVVYNDSRGDFSEIVRFVAEAYR